MKHYDILIIGAGAAGLAAACTVKQERPELSVGLLDGNDRVGRKIYATGNGRCNLSNMAAPGVQYVLDFFGQLGLVTTADAEGRVYPASGEAADVVYVLEHFLKSRSADFLLHSEVTEIGQSEEGFLVTTSKGKLTADKVLLAAGGKAGAQYGSKGQGYRLAEHLDHHKTAVYPVLTGVETSFLVPMEQLAGCRADARVRLLCKGKPVFEESGQVQFAKYGLSGIVIFNASSFIRLEEEKTFEDYALELDLAPQITEEDLTFRVAVNLQQGLNPLRGLVPHALAEVLAPGGESKEGTFIAREPAAALAHRAKNAVFPVTGVRGWKMAQCTGGGIIEEEVSPDTMESLVCPGLYLAGEILAAERRIKQ